MYIKKKKNIRLIELDRPTKEYSSFLEKLMIWNEFALRSRIEEYTVFLEKSIIRNEFTFYSKMKEYSCFLRWFGMNLHFVREWDNIRVSWEMRYEMYIKKKKNICLIELDRPTKEYSSFLEKSMIRNKFALRWRMKEYTAFLEKYNMK